MTSQGQRPLSALVRLLAGATLVILIVLGVRQVRPPDVVPASAPPDVFSAERAQAHLDAITAAPRPSGSEGHRRAREIILATLSALGVQAEVQQTSVVSTRWGLPYDAAHVENIVARLRGTESSRALILVAHYDSVNNSPGAGDDGSGVATLLETLRALVSGPPLKNDAIFLFTDAEEGGILGAKAFMDEHPFRQDLGLALNFDARGAGGPAMMFDTTPESGRLIKELAESAPHPLASSLSGDVARFLGHDTDFRVFKDAGVPAMNFAIAGRAAHYHAPSDTPGNLDLRSVQHMGSYALSLARRFGAMDLRQVRAPDAVYFSVLRDRLVVYPRELTLPLTALLAVLFAAVAWLAVARGAARPGRIVEGALWFALLLVAVPAAGGCLVYALRRIHPVLRVMRADPYDPEGYRIALALLAAGMAAGVCGAARRKLGACELSLGAQIWWLLLLVGTTFVAPGASYLFAWPLAGSLAALAIVLARRRDVTPGLLDTAALVAGAIPAIAIAVPVTVLLFDAVQLPMAAAPVLLIVLVFGLLLPAIQAIFGGSPPALTLGLAGTGAVVLALAFTREGFSETRPRPTCLAYGADLTAGKAHWLSTDEELEPWAAVHFEAGRQEAPSFELQPYVRIVRQSEARLLPLPGPKIDVLEDAEREGVRTLRLRVSSERHARWLLASVISETEVVGTAVDGKRADPPLGFASTAKRPWGFTYMGLPDAGMEWVLKTRGSGPVEIRVVDRSDGLPRELLRGPWPKQSMPVPFQIADGTFVARSFKF